MAKKNCVTEHSVELLIDIEGCYERSGSDFGPNSPGRATRSDDDQFNCRRRYVLTSGGDTVRSYYERIFYSSKSVCSTASRGGIRGPSYRSIGCRCETGQASYMAFSATVASASGVELRGHCPCRALSFCTTATTAVTSNRGSRKCASEQYRDSTRPSREVTASNIL